MDDKKWADTLTQSGWETVTLTDRQRALCSCAVKLTRTPAEMNDQDVEALRQAGLGDVDILDLIQVISYFNYINRIADALNVPMEPEW